MAIIPVGQKFHTVSSHINTVDKGSAEVQADRAVYSMQDIIDTTGAAAISYPEFTTDLETQVQVGTVLIGGVDKDLFYKRFEEVAVSGNGFVSTTYPEIPTMIKVNVIIEMDSKGGMMTGSQFFQDNDATANAWNEKGLLNLMLFTPSVFNATYKVTFEVWYT